MAYQVNKLSSYQYNYNAFIRLLQISSVLFSGILFVGLYTKVGSIRAK
jgi:hypothetical protein